MTISPIVTELDLTSLRALVRGAVHGPDDAGYATAGFNLAVTRTPYAVVDVADADDIAAVIRFAGTSGLRVAVFATGHGGVEVGVVEHDERVGAAQFQHAFFQRRPGLGANRRTSTNTTRHRYRSDTRVIDHLTDPCVIGIHPTVNPHGHTRISENLRNNCSTAGYVRRML